LTSITYLSPGTTDTRQIVFAVNQALERLQNLTPTPSANSIIGTTTNDSAAAGNLGEIMAQGLSSGSAAPLSNNTVGGIVSLSLTPGDWDIYGYVNFTGGSSTVANYCQSSVSTSSSAFGASDHINGVPMFGLKPFNFVSPVVLPTLYKRESLATTTSVWLNANCSFSVDVCSAWGAIFARRVR
jgi:hypothetical protein